MARQSGATLIGFNNNVRYRGHRFHLQTEDSGRGKPHILSHLFVNGGHIIETLRCDYSEHLDDAQCTTIIARLMKKQHVELAMLLRDGHLDDKIAHVLASLGEATGQGSPAGSSSEIPQPFYGNPRPSGGDASGEEPPPSVFGLFQEETLDDLILRQLERP